MDFSCISSFVKSATKQLINTQDLIEKILIENTVENVKLCIIVKIIQIHNSDILGAVLTGY